jgi:hypothetical protein
MSNAIPGLPGLAFGMYAVLALVTNRTKRTFQICARLGYAYQVTHFCVGSGGHDPESPITARTPDPDYDPPALSIGDRLPEDRVIDATAITSAEDDPYYATTWTCVLDMGVDTGTLSSVYLLDKLVYTGTPTPAQLATYEAALATAGLPAVDKLWVHSFAYTPLAIKVDTELKTLPVSVVY